VLCLSLRAGLSSNPISGIRKPRAAIDSRVSRIFAHCWMRVTENSTFGSLVA
jgi:hypothetical protein